MFNLLDPENGYNSNALKAADTHMKMKQAPKPQTPQNAKFANDRAAEKMAIVSANAGRDMSGRGG